MTYLIGSIALVVIAVAYYLIGKRAGEDECSKAISGLDIFDDDWASDSENYKKFKKSHK